MIMSRSECLLWIIASWLLCGELEAAVIQTNIDTKEPSVIRSPARSDTTDDGFGWAAIFHQVEMVSDTDSMDEVLRKTRVIIGAPRGSYPGGLNLSDPELPAAIETGLVYSCPIGPGICEGVTGDRDVYIGGSVDVAITNGQQSSPVVNVPRDAYDQSICEGRLFDQAPDSIVAGRFSSSARYERKKGQLMGSVLFSNGDNIVACAPHWVTTAFALNGVQPRGICFSGNRDLTSFRTQYPCVGGGSSGNTRGNGFCSGGYSTTIVDERIFIGAPGYDQSGGGVFSRLLSAVNSDPFTLSINPINEGTGIDIQSAYYGSQVISGYIRSTSTADILISSPRDNQDDYIGKVYLYDINTPQVQEIIANGSQIAEFFGYSIATCDLTGDGFDELLVGAPMYTNLDPLRVEQGRLYVFFNNGGSIDPSPIIFEGPASNARFGLAVTNLGDIDADGHEDLAVSAPYEASSGSTSNTGAVYIYYGRDTKEEFNSQQPQRIHADDITVSVNTLPLLRTFGFSLSGNIDVDQNNYKDLVVGGYLDQAVVVLRSLPFVNITVSFDDIADIRVDGPNPSFQVTMRASYEGLGVTGALSVPFSVTQESRLFFSSGNPEVVRGDGVFSLAGPDIEAEEVITVYAMSDFTETRPYQLTLELNDIIRSTNIVDGLQPISDLSQFPRIRQFGNNMATVGIIDPCGFGGCSSDITLSVINLNSLSIRLVQGLERSVLFSIEYLNIGLEEARDLTFTVSGLPSIFNQIVLSRDTQGGATFDCTKFVAEGETSSTTCNLQPRLLPNVTQLAILVLVIDSTELIGNEEDFNISLSVGVDTTSNNSDVNLVNNRLDILFSVESRSDINMDVSFRRTTLSYVGVVPQTILSSSDLGEAVSLAVKVDNEGPSTINNAAVIIRFPSQVSPNQFYLYPSVIIYQLSASSLQAGTTVNCTSDGILDPNNLDTDQSTGSRKRSLPMSVSNKRARRVALNSISRSKRQTSTKVSAVNCTVHPCTELFCNIRRLTTDAVTIGLEFFIDERFFGTADQRNYSIRVEASVTVVEEFQMRFENTSDNSDFAVVLLTPPAVESSTDSVFIHVIIWPSIAGATFLLVLIVLFLYFVGFFRRKKPGEEEEIEGDFTAPSDAKEEEVTGL